MRTPASSSSRSRAIVAASVEPSSTITSSCGSSPARLPTASPTNAPSLKHGMTTAVRTGAVTRRASIGVLRSPPMPGQGLAWRPWHGWLPAVLPAQTRTYASADPELADTLAASGARAGSPPDVELATSAGGLTGEAPCAIVFLHRTASEGSGLAGRVGGRLGGVARNAAGAAAARRRLRALGYTDVDLVPFDQERRPALAPPAPADARALPLSAVLAGRRRHEEAPTVLEAAGAAAGEPVLRADARLGLSGVVLVLGERR